MSIDQHIAFKKNIPFARLTRLLVVALTVVAIVNLAMIGLRFWFYTILDQVMVNGWDNNAEFADQANIWGFVVTALVFLLTAILFLVWFHRARKNVDVLQAEGLAYNSSAAVGWWFVPLAHLVVPYRIAKDIWLASNPETYESGKPTAWLSDEDWGPVTLWWTFWIMYSIASWVSRFGDDPTEIDEFQYKLIVQIVAHVLLLPAALFAIRFVKGVYRRQEERYALIEQINDSIAETDLQPIL